MEVGDTLVGETISLLSSGGIGVRERQGGVSKSMYQCIHMHLYVRLVTSESSLWK